MVKTHPVLFELLKFTPPIWTWGKISSLYMATPALRVILSINCSIFATIFASRWQYLPKWGIQWAQTCTSVAALVSVSLSASGQVNYCTFTDSFNSLQVLEYEFYQAISLSHTQINICNLFIFKYLNL